jgi:large subunit ribosomal protein L5
MPRLQDRYRNDVMPALTKRFGYKNVNQLPKLVKVVVNMGVGEATSDPKALDAAAADLATITGQKALITKAKRSIANFKLRAGVPIGAKVTLRGARMFYFLDKLFNASLPRIRDFRGISTSGFDGRGNYTLGLKEQLIFPEIVYDKVDKVRGMDITIVTSARTDEEGLELLRALGMPFKAQ